MGRKRGERILTALKEKKTLAEMARNDEVNSSRLRSQSMRMLTIILESNRNEGDERNEGRRKIMRDQAAELCNEG